MSGLRQRGFTLIELSIVLLIGSGFVVALTLAMHAQLLQLRAKTMAQRYVTVQLAANRYVQAFRAELQRLPPDCSESAYQADGARAQVSAVAYGLCAVVLHGATGQANVRNGMQPDVEELRALGLLEPGNNHALALERDSRVYRPSTSGDIGARAPERLAVLVRRSCAIGDCSGSGMLETLVYNLQPYLLTGGNVAFDRRDQINVLLAELGDGATISRAASDGHLVDGEDKVRLQNPVRDESGVGIPGIVALRSYAHPNDDLWARRDGRTVITGDWDFGANKLHGVSNLEATAVQARDMALSGSAEMRTAKVGSMEVQHLYPQHLRLPVHEAGLLTPTEN